METSAIFFLIGAALFLVLAYYLMRYFNEKKALIRELKKTGTIQISDFKNGAVGFVCGNIQLNNAPVQSPLSDMLCAFYLIEVFHVDSDEEASVSIERVGNILVISDRTGVALIKLKKATLYLKVTNEYLTEKYFYPDIKLDEYLVQKGISTKGIWGATKRMRAEEYLLTENKKLYIHGKGTWQKASSFGLNCEGDKVLVFEVVHATHLSVLDLGEDAIV